MLVQQEIRQRRWKWIGHTLHKQASGQHCTQSLNLEPIEEKERRRPRNTWRHDLEAADAKETGYSWRQLEIFAQDRNALRNNVGGLCPRRGREECVDWFIHCCIGGLLSHIFWDFLVCATDFAMRQVSIAYCFTVLSLLCCSTLRPPLKASQWLFYGALSAKSHYCQDSLCIKVIHTSDGFVNVIEAFSNAQVAFSWSHSQKSSFLWK